MQEWHEAMQRAQGFRRTAGKQLAIGHTWTAQGNMILAKEWIGVAARVRRGGASAPASLGGAR